MNIVLITPEQAQSEIWSIQSSRQLQHLHQHLAVKVGDQLKVGIRGGARYLTEVIAVTADEIQLKALVSQAVPEKLPVTLIVAMPRPKVLRRLIMDSVTLGVENMIVVDTDDAVLICPRGNSQQVRELVQKLKELGLNQYL